jgi:hypothetical protein
MKEIDVLSALVQSVTESPLAIRIDLVLIVERIDDLLTLDRIVNIIR